MASQDRSTSTTQSAEPLLGEVCFCEVSSINGHDVLRVAHTCDVSAQNVSAVDGLHSAQRHRASNLVGMALYACSSVFLTVQLSCAHYLGKSHLGLHPPIDRKAC